MRVKFQKVVALLLSAVILVGVIPTMNVAAAENNFVNSKLSVVANKESVLATGVSLDSYTVYDKNGDQVKMFVTTADMNVDTVELFASYKDMDPTNYGMSKLTEQVASFDEKAAGGDEYYKGTVVAGINASYYNMITGKPTGTFVMNGIDVTTESEGNAYGYFAVMKDGSVKIGNKGDYSKDKGNIQEAIGIYQMLIVDGEICAGLNTVQKYPRQTIGITADNKVILMMADGNQAPSSIGLTVQEQAEVMLDLGCVWAGHLDGGGSGTYACKPEGSDEFVITNSPSDGSERSISNGFIIVSTEAASKEFNRVKYEVECNNVTPGTSIPVRVSGVSSSGNAADIPLEVTYTTSNGTFDGEVFTAGDEVGESVITAMYNGEEVGTTTINVVYPEKISFASSEITVPFGKSVSLDLSATLGVKEVVVKAEDFKFTFTDETVGTMSGFYFTANADGSSTESEVIATLIGDESITAKTKIVLGRGSEVVYDFEDGTDQNVVINETPGTKYNYVWPEVEQSVVDRTTGQVHSGEYALGGYINYGNSLESGYMKTSIYATETKVFENAVRVGVWVYIPDECVGLWARWTLREVTGYNEDGTPIFGSSTINSNNMDTTAGGTGIVATFDEPGWHYLHADVSKYKAVGWAANSAMMQFYISDRDGSAYNYVAADNSNIPGKFQFYVDDFTVDYSTAVEDREAPVFSNVTYATEGMADAATLNGQTIVTDKVTIAASVDDYKGKKNFTGLDTASIKAYVDGVEMECNYTNNIVYMDLDSLTNGKHTIKFAAKDKTGNYGYVYEYINVEVEDHNSTVKLVPADESLDRIKLGSVYNMNLVATAIDEVDKVEVVIDLDNNSNWQLDYMNLADGFEAEYSVEKTENIATIIITRSGENDMTGEGVLATFPVRTWELKTGYKYPNGTKAGQEAFTYTQWKNNNKEFWRMSVIATVDKGVLTRVDNTVSTFTGERVFCDTEMWANYANMTSTDEGLAYYNAWDGGHIHSAVAIDDKAATCTKGGYTNRTFCEVCNSVVDWGTKTEATGHEYGFVDGVLQCTSGCAEKYTGTYEGKEYVDGLLVADGWSDNNYYLDGEKLTGVQKVESPDLEEEFYYDFGDDGVSKGKYTGLLYDDETNVYHYSKLGKLASGWIQIEDEWFYFDSETLGNVETYNNGFVTYSFEENGKLVSGLWYYDGTGSKYYYGPDYYRCNGTNTNAAWFVIDGNTYAISREGYRHEGVMYFRESNAKDVIWYDFGTDGICKGVFTGIADYNGVSYYIIDGVKQYCGLFEYEGNLYYADHNYGDIVKNTSYYCFVTNGLKPRGTYTFDAEGKMVLKNGIINGYYYIDDVKQYCGLFEYEGYLYYADHNYGDIIKDTSYYCFVTNGLKPRGTYTFDAEGKMVLKNGIINGYYYIDDEKQYCGLFEYEGSLYYADHNYGDIIKDTSYYCYVTNGLKPRGTYTFDAEGKMVLKNGIIDGYYYIDDVKQYCGLFEYEGNLYYADHNYGDIIKGKSYYCYVTNGLKPRGTYIFDAEGKMITE